MSNKGVGAAPEVTAPPREEVLTRATLSHTAPAVRRPAYDPAAISVGVVHVGPGAFHRAHQADYLDTVLARDPRWGIAAVALRHSAMPALLAAQNGLYTLAIRDAVSCDRILAPHRRFYGPANVTNSVGLLDDPAIELVTATVTEKGYYLGADGSLDLTRPDIVADLAAPARPRTLQGWLVAALARRRMAGLMPPTVLSCDNLSSNGATLRATVLTFAEARDTELAKWIAGEVRFPNSVVDSITPAPSLVSLAAVAERLGVRDACAVEREAFSSWVIEQAPGGALPDLESAGAIFTRALGEWELAKLRILNGSHSTLAYLGLLAGHRTIGAAIADPALKTFVEAMVRDEIAPTLQETAGLDAGEYAATTFRRFANPAIAHRLQQIATDGSQKLPQRLIAPLVERLVRQMPVPRLTHAVAAWCAWVIARARGGIPIDDPLAPALAQAGRSSDPTYALLGIAAIFPAVLREDPTFAATLAEETGQLLARSR